MLKRINITLAAILLAVGCATQAKFPGTEPRLGTLQVSLKREMTTQTFEEQVSSVSITVKLGTYQRTLPLQLGSDLYHLGYVADFSGLPEGTAKITANAYDQGNQLIGTDISYTQIRFGCRNVVILLLHPFGEMQLINPILPTPTPDPNAIPSLEPTVAPTIEPTVVPSVQPSLDPTETAIEIPDAPSPGPLNLTDPAVQTFFAQYSPNYIKGQVWCYKTYFANQGNIYSVQDRTQEVLDIIDGVCTLRYTFPGQTGTSTESTVVTAPAETQLQVVGTYRITVPAGSFDVVKLNVTSGGFTMIDWFAKGLGGVKTYYIDPNTQTEVTTVLCSVTSSGSNTASSAAFNTANLRNNQFKPFGIPLYLKN